MEKIIQVLGVDCWRKAKLSGVKLCISRGLVWLTCSICSISVQFLTGQKVTASHAAVLLAKLFSTPGPKRNTTVLVVDEVRQRILCFLSSKDCKKWGFGGWEIMHALSVSRDVTGIDLGERDANSSSYLFKFSFLKRLSILLPCFSLPWISYWFYVLLIQDME